MSNVMVTILYWGLVHNEIIDTYEGLQRAFLYVVHTLPQIAFVLNLKYYAMIFK